MFIHNPFPSVLFSFNLNVNKTKYLGNQNTEFFLKKKIWSLNLRILQSEFGIWGEENHT